jgi:hypothetical protein
MAKANSNDSKSIRLFTCGLPDALADRPPARPQSNPPCGATGGLLVHATVFWALNVPEEVSGEHLRSVTVAADR